MAGWMWEQAGMNWESLGALAGPQNHRFTAETSELPQFSGLDLPRAAEPFLLPEM